MSQIVYSANPVTVPAGSQEQFSIQFPSPYLMIKVIHLNPSLNMQMTIQQSSDKSTIFQSDFENCTVDVFVLTFELAVVGEFIITLVNNSGAPITYAPSFTLA